MLPATDSYVVRNSTRGVVLAEHVRIADSVLTRFRGLLGTSTLAAGHGLLIRPCQNVHSVFMRYPIDVVFIDGEGRVARTVANFAQNRVSPWVRRAAAVLELPAGTLATRPAHVGDLLELAPSADIAHERESTYGA